MLERDLKTSVMRYLKELGYFVKYHSGMGGTAGVPDIIGCVKSKFVAIELKVEPNKPTELQLHNIEKIRQANGEARVCYTVDEVKEFIQEIINKGEQ